MRTVILLRMTTLTALIRTRMIRMTMMRTITRKDIYDNGWTTTSRTMDSPTTLICSLQKSRPYLNFSASAKSHSFFQITLHTLTQTRPTSLANRHGFPDQSYFRITMFTPFICDLQKSHICLIFSIHENSYSDTSRPTTTSYGVYQVCSHC